MGNASTQNALQLQTMSLGGKSLDAVLIGDEVWFYASSLSGALEYSSTIDMLGGLPADEKGVYPVQTPQGVEEGNFLNEPGFYRVVVRSKAEAAESVKRWVYQDVLPKLRTTGQYRLHQEAKRLGISFDYTEAQWEWLKLRPGFVDLLPLAAAGYNGVEITRMLGYATPSGITARKQIEKLKDLGFLPQTIEPRAKQLERRIKAERLGAAAS